MALGVEADWSHAKILVAAPPRLDEMMMQACGGLCAAALDGLLLGLPGLLCAYLCVFLLSAAEGVAPEAF